MIIIDENRPCYKGNLHMHTTASDGRKTPSEACREYQEKGYDFVALTDHWKVSGEDRFADMLVLPGVEYDWTLGTQVLHLVVLPKKPEDLAGVGRGITYPEVIRQARDCGALLIAAHPAWSLNTTEFLLGLQGVDLSEVYNSVSDLPIGTPRGFSDGPLDVAAANGKFYGWLANDDTHYYNGDQFRGFNMVQAGEFTPEGIREALRKGHFYASQGPEFRDVRIEEGKLRVRTSEVIQYAFVSNLFWAPDRCRNGENMTECEYEIRPGETFVRCMIQDREGKFAWTSPVDLRNIDSE